MPTSALLIGQLLLEQGMLDTAGLSRALALQESNPEERLGALLLRLGLISEATLLEALARQLSLPLLDSNEINICLPRIIQWHGEHAIPSAQANRLAFFVSPNENGDLLVVGAKDPLDSSLIDYLESGPCLNRRYRLAIVSTRDLERVLSQIYRPASSGPTDDLRRLAEDAPIVELVNGLMARATDSRASDVHIEPEELGFIVRYRIDGQLHATEHYPRERFDAVVSRIKLISGLDIAERRLPQDGRFSTRSSGVDSDVRVSVIPGVQGESLVLRLLPNMQGKRFDLRNIGMEEDHLAIYRHWMAQPDGIVLVTGPTGSGKSTTLYATLVACDTEHERILTVEDPVEYQIPGVTQFQVHPDIGFTFPAALRSILRHDPDTIMIGEIRDVETARIAVQASLTGHRVFSTLHTNDSPTAFLRLADMGVESFLVGATVRGVVAQRLVRRLCEHCAKPLDTLTVPPSVISTLEHLGIAAASATFRAPVGCDACSHTGYRGRTAIYELMEATDTLRSVLNQPSPALSSLMAAAQPGFRFLREDGLLKAARGITSLAEVFLIAGSHAEWVAD
jgi:general secretion pathway protein E